MSERSTFRRAAAVVVAAVAVFALAGCGEGDETTAGAGAGAAQTPSTSAAPATTATTLLPSTTAAAPAPARCTNVSFSSNTEDVATDVRSTGPGCPEAEAFVRKVGTQVSAPSGPPRVEVDGYVCVRTSVRSGDHGPQLGTFECTSGANKVTFTRALVG